MNKEKQTDLLITHSRNCMDAKMCATIYTKWMRELEFTEDSYKIKYTQYGEDTIDMSEVKDKVVVIVDFSYSFEILEEINKHAMALFVLDHHKLDQKVLDLEYVTVDTNKCGAVLLWEYFYNENIPPLVKSVDVRDRWTKDWVSNVNQDQEIGAALTLIKYNDYAKFEEHLFDTSGLLEVGKTILGYQQQSLDKIDYAYKKDNMLRIDWCGYNNIPLINTTTLISEVGNMISQTEPFALMFFFTKDSLVISFRSSEYNGKIVDGTQLGFQGHAASAACAFKLDTPNLFDKLFIKKQMDLDFIMKHRRE